MKTSNPRKIAIIGCGFVGSSIAYTVMQSNLFTEMVLIDANHNKAEGEALDISHGLPFSQPMQIYAGDYQDIQDAAIVVITAGANQKPGETRLDLVHKNTAILKDIIPQVCQPHFNGILLIVANPVDILTYVAIKLSGLPANRVFGSGTVLDTARLKFLIGQRLSVDSANVHAYIVGEHGDSEIPIWSSARISGIPFEEFCDFKNITNISEITKEIGDEVRDSAYEIIEKKNATYYGVAMATMRILRAIIRNENSVLPVTSMMNGEFGIHDVALALPTLVNSEGVGMRSLIELSVEERQKLQNSANGLKEIIAQLDI